MTQVNISQKSFATGEISPELEVRTDVSNYEEALGDSLNVLCTNKGDLIPRPGSEFVSVTANPLADSASGKSRLIPFKFSETESYILEFTEKCLRIHKGGKPLNWTPVAGGATYETINSAHFLHEMQYPIVAGGGGSAYGTESGQFVFPGEGSFPYDAGAGPFIISDIAGASISGLSYMHGSALADTGARTVLNNKVFWIHSVERGAYGTGLVNKGDNANNIIGKPVDKVRITWHPSFAEGGSAYDPEKFLIALNGTTARPSDSAFPPTKWSFYTGTIKASVTDVDEILTISDIDYRNYFGPTDTHASGTNTSPIPYLESELKDIQYANVGDLMFLTHPNHQPLKLERVGSQSFKIRQHHTKGGPWRPYPTYPNTYWGGTYHITGAAATVLPGNGANGPSPTNADLRYTTDATDVIYLFKSKGTPDIITNSDLSSTVADDSIVGRRIRICLPVGTPLFSVAGVEVSGTVLEALNDAPANWPNTRDIVNATAGPNTSSSSTIRKAPRVLGSVISQETTDSSTYFWLEGKVEALVNTSGSVKHKNPTEGYRIRITRGANFFRTQVFAQYIGPSTRTKIGRLFENKQPDNTGGWPIAVAVINNRLIYAGNDENPNALAFSSSGNFDDFTPDDYGYNISNTISDADLNSWSVAGTYNAETFDFHSFVYLLQEGLADKIKWLKATNYGLIAGTENGMYLSPKLPSGQAFTPFNFTMRLISDEGCNSVQAEYIDGKIYYISSLGDKLLSMEYVNEADGFRPKVESILSEHLLKTGVKAITYARTPINIIWLTMNDGSLVSAVRLDVNKEKGFFKHRIACADYNIRSKSIVESIAVIPSDDSSFDQLYLSVRRPRPLTGVTAASSFTDPTDISGIKDKEINTLERLTQFSPFLKDSREFVGLDCSVSDNSHYDGNQSATASYKSNISIDNVYNFNDNASPLTTDLEIETSTAHGLSATNSFMLKGLNDSLSFLNINALHTANVVSTLVVKTTPLESPDLIDASSASSSELYLGNATLLKAQSVSLPGFLEEAAVDIDLSKKYFPCINNFSFFRNGILDFSIYTLGENGVSSSYSQFDGGDPSGFFSIVDGFNENRVLYARASNGFASSSFLSALQGNIFERNYYSYNCGFKPHLYFTTLPPKINNQLGSADLSYTFISSASIQVIDTHQINVKNNDADSDSVPLIDDEYKNVDTQPTGVLRREGTYKQQLVQVEENTRGQVRFEPEPGYPFRVLEINLRGERATRG